MAASRKLEMVQERTNALVSRWRKAFEVGGEY